jgi:hypothetical protein
MRPAPTFGVGPLHAASSNSLTGRYHPWRAMRKLVVVTPAGHVTLPAPSLASRPISNSSLRFASWGRAAVTLIIGDDLLQQRGGFILCGAVVLAHPANESAALASTTISLRCSARASGSLQSISGFSGESGSIYYPSRSPSSSHLIAGVYPSECSRAS